MKRPRLPLAASGVLLTVAVGVPTAWWAGRPDAAAGEAVVTGAGLPAPASAPARAPAPSPAPEPVHAVDRLPTLSARQAGVDARARVVDAASPVRVQVPSLGIEADVDPVGVRRDGAMELPADGARVGWYRHGPAPGAGAGSAVLAGHVDTRRYGPGALFPLQQVEPGAEVVVDAADGTRTRWRVVGRERVDKAALPVDDLFRRDGAARLVLVTCGGEYLPEVPGYRDNVVVVAERSG